MKTEKAPENWKNRITGLKEKPAKDFKFNPENWRLHGAIQRAAINEVLSNIGWVTGVIENLTTGNLIDGHARIEEAIKYDEDQLIPYLEVELTLEEEKKILLLLDPIGAMAQTDAAKFQSLEESVNLESSSLLEVTSEISARDSLNTVEIEKQSHEMGEMLRYMKFGKYNSPMTEEEEAALEARFNAHLTASGTNFGFVSELLGL